MTRTQAIPHTSSLRAKALLLPCSLLTLACLLCLAGPAAAFGTDAFPCPPALEKRVQFWVDVFTRYSGNERVLHDSRYPWIVYEIFPVTDLNQDQIKRKIEARKKVYMKLLEGLAIKDPAAYTAEESRVAALFEGVPEAARFTRARERLRSQPGVKEQMQVGIARSGRYVDRIGTVLDSLGVPRELGYLPHVESSFHPGARSKVGAVGLWQFTAGTGKRFLKIENDLDERLDPFLATEAAARYLKEAHATLESWPLAVVSYNHGVGGMLKAKAKLGTNEVATILQGYESPSFGFASQNFYCEFLAVVEIAEHPTRYFEAVEIEPPLRFDEYELPQHCKISGLLDAFAMNRSELSGLNPALGQSYLQGSRPIPKGYRLRLPLDRYSDPAGTFASIPSQDRFDQLPRPAGYKVRRGDTLGAIARRHRVSVAELKKMNNIGRDNTIQVGQVLVLPDAAFPVTR